MLTSQALPSRQASSPRVAVRLTCVTGETQSATLSTPQLPLLADRLIPCPSCGTCSPRIEPVALDRDTISFAYLDDRWVVGIAWQGPAGPMFGRIP